MSVQTLALLPEQASSAALIQQAIDSLGPEGGEVLLPRMEIILDRGIELRSGVTLVGQGSGTVLRKAPARVYPLSGYHNYGMRDVPLLFTDGLEPGMTVAVRDNARGGFFETFARLTWVEGTWVGLDRGIEADYAANQEPVLITAFPLVFGLGVERVALRNVSLDGNRAQQPLGILACRGAAVYLAGSRDIEVSDVEETGFLGEGLGFQMCRDVRILRCRFRNNSGNGYHPGAGSTGALFEDCLSEGNGAAGFFFCVRANHITVRGCRFVGNQVCGVSVGTRDCHNLVDNCRMVDNGGPGVLFRPSPRPVEVHSVVVQNCHVAGNAHESGRAQIDIHGDAHDLVIRRNAIAGIESTGDVPAERAGIYVAPQAERIWLADNHITGGIPSVIADARCLAGEDPGLQCGYEAVEPEHYRHLGALPYQH